MVVDGKADDMVQCTPEFTSIDVLPLGEDAGRLREGNRELCCDPIIAVVTFVVSQIADSARVHDMLAAGTYTSFPLQRNS